MSNQIQTFGLCFGVILLLPWLGGSPAIGQQPASPGFQQQIRRGFDRVKDQIAEKFGRPASVGRPAGVHAQHDRPPHNRSLQHHPPHHQFGRHSQPLPPQRLPVQASSPPGFEQRQYHTADEQRGYYDQETHPAAYWQQPATDPNTLRTEPAMPGPRLQGSSLRDPSLRQPSLREPSRQEVGEYSSQRNSGQPLPSYDAFGAGNATRELSPSDSQGWTSQQYANYARQVQSGTLQTKPPAMDYYNERRYDHFSNRITATERAIILEDELARSQENRKTLEARIQSLEAQLKQRDFEIEQLRNSVAEASQQLSAAASLHQQLDERIAAITAQRNMEKAASDKLLDELRRQLSDLLANELVRSN